MSTEGVYEQNWVTRYRRYSLAVTFVCAFVNGVVLEVDERLEIPAVMMFASAVVLWCQLDALFHRKIYQRAFALLMMWTWPVGVLVHLVWTRRWRGLPIYLGLAMGQLAATSAGAGIGHVIAQTRPSSPSTRSDSTP